MPVEFELSKVEYNNHATLGEKRVFFDHGRILIGRGIMLEYQGL